MPSGGVAALNRPALMPPASEPSLYLIQGTSFN
jgi:hypothetical protein